MSAAASRGLVRRGAGRALAAALAVAAGGCTPLRENGAPSFDPCAPSAAEMAGWQPVVTDPFRFSLPAGYRDQRARGIDSFVGQWSAADGRSVHFDYGPYSWPMDDAQSRLQDFRECRMEVGGHPVRVVSGFDAAGTMGEGGPKYVVAAAWRDLSDHAHLTLVATAPDPAGRPALAAIIQSVRFTAP